MDDTGAVVGYNEFDPYGNPVNNTSGGEPYGYTGEWYEGYTELLHLRARWYAAYLNQFISPDTIIPDYFDPQSLNKYAYSRNNPVNRTDPSGYQSECDKCLDTTRPTFQNWPVDKEHVGTINGYGPNNYSYEQYVKYGNTKANPYYNTNGIHNGFDFNTIDADNKPAEGYSLFAMAEGTVWYVGNNKNVFAAGPNKIIIRHGEYLVIYGHSSKTKLPTVKEGDKVTANQLIGYSGRDETDFEHLHLEVRILPGASTDKNRECGVTYKDLEYTEWHGTTTYNPLSFFTADIESEILGKKPTDTINEFDADHNGYPDYIDGKEVGYKTYVDSTNLDDDANFWQTHPPSKTP